MSEKTLAATILTGFAMLVTAILLISWAVRVGELADTKNCIAACADHGVLRNGGLSTCICRP